MRQYCIAAHSEAWCLQYNQHLGKTLLVPLDHPKTILDQVDIRKNGSFVYLYLFNFIYPFPLTYLIQLAIS